MVAINISGMKGEVPRVDSRLLPSNYASKAKNTKYYSGRLDIVKGPLLSQTSALAVAIKTLFRYNFNGVFNWLVFAGDADVVRSPTANDSRGRLYYTGDFEPRMTTFADGISGGSLVYPNAWFVLGVSPPTIAMTLATVTGGGAPTESRAYIDTFVTQFGEESGPGLPVVFTGNANGTWNLTALQAPPPNSGTISAAVKDTPLAGQVEVTLDTVYGLQAFERLTFAGVAGMTDLNGTFALVSVDTATNKVVVTLTTTQTYSAAADTWTRQAPHNLTGMKRRIYRTVGTNTDYKFVAEQAATTTTYNDAATSPGTAITSFLTRTPPKDMTCLTGLANGSLVGLHGNEICFSDQYLPHSWPTANRYSFPAKGVALVAAGNSVLILTETFPFVATATVPSAASIDKVPGENPVPCVSKRGVVDIGAGAICPSHDGLYLVTPSGTTNLTEKLYRIDQWRTENPSTFVAVFHDQIYYAIQGSGASRSILALDTIDRDSARRFTPINDAIYANPYDGKLYVTDFNKIMEFDADDANRYTAEWESKEFVFNAPIRLGAAKVLAEFDDITTVDGSFIATNNAILADTTQAVGIETGMFELNKYETNGGRLTPNPNISANTISFYVKANGVEKYRKTLFSGDAFKLPKGFKSEKYVLGVESKVQIHSIAAASTIDELA